ncbi:capsid protein, partial [Methylosinus sp. Sm6]|nr:capsid protein [Methylosinus sp. Sm6]
MAPSRPFVVNPVLTGIAIGYSNPDVALIADQVMPRVEVGGESFKWTEYPLAEAFTVPSTRVGRKGRVPEVEFSGTERDGSVET